MVERAKIIWGQKDQWKPEARGGEQTAREHKRVCGSWKCSTAGRWWWVMRRCAFASTHRTVHFKQVHCSVFKLKLKNKYCSDNSHTHVPSFLSKHYRSHLHIPEAVPQHGGTHHAEEKMLAITSGGKSVTFLWIWSKFNTNARNTPIKNSTTPRIIKFTLLLVTDEM